MDKLEKIAEICTRLEADFTICSEWKCIEPYAMLFVWRVEGSIRGMSNSNIQETLEEAIDEMLEWLEKCDAEHN